MSYRLSRLGRGYGRWLIFGSCTALVATSCGSSDSKRKVTAEEAGEAGNAAGGVVEMAGGRAGTPDSVGGAGGAAETASGAGGMQVASEAGAGGQAEPSCSPDSCQGVCLSGVCELETIVSADVNLSTDSLTEGRDCAEAAAYSVTALSGSQATLASAPEPGCLENGDEVLLINLQGTPSDHNNVGHWELLHVAEQSGTGVQFATSIARFYGTGVTNTGLGVKATEQRVVLVRVPRFGRLVVEAGVTVTAQAWDGVLGGVVALRAAQLELSGKLDASALGYRGGRWSQDDITCSDSTQTEAGESIGGTGSASTLRNLGASGGIGPGSTSFNSDNVVVATPGHSQAGQAGFNPKGRTIGEVGAAYGNPDATTLTLGSGPGGGLTCVLSPNGPTPSLSAGTGQAGGIALLLVDDLELTATGAISATPPDAVRDVAFAGGYVFIHGSALSLGSSQVTAQGSVGHRPLGPAAGQTNQGSPGYVVLSAPHITGTTDPPALLAANPAALGL